MSGKSSTSAPCHPWRIYAAGAAVCAAMTAGVYLFGVRPAARKHEEAQSRHQELNDRKRQAAALVGQLTSSRAQLAAVNQALVRQTLQLQPSNTLNHRISRLNELAEASGLTIDEIRSGQPEDGPDYLTLPILIAGNGTYPACARFLHKLRVTFPDMAVRSFETTNNSASPDSPAATFQFDLAWHAAKE